MKRPSVRIVAMALAVMALAAGLYATTVGHGFILLDDQQYIPTNPLVNQGLSWATARAAWVQSCENYWAPLLWLSFMVDVEMFGLQPWGFHLVNVVLFALNAGLLFVLFSRWTGRAGVAMAATLLWMLHPTRVESVAWVVERKDVLSGLFLLLGLGAYVETHRSQLRGGLWLAWLFMALGGATKQILIVMPALLMLLDIWPLQRTSWDRIRRDGWRLGLEKWAFWGLAFALAVVPVWLHQQAAAMLESSFLERARMIPQHYLFYLQKTIWSTGLSVLLGNMDFRWAMLVLSCGLLGGITWALWRYRKAAPWALWGWVWFVGALFPLSGWVWAGAEKLATRFMYVPHMGLALAVSLAAAQGCSRWRAARPWAVAGLVLVLAAYAGMTLHLLPFWRSNLTLFPRVLQGNPQSVHGFDNLALAYYKAGRYADWQAFLEGFRAQHPQNMIADIHYAWWNAAMLGDVDKCLETIEDLTGGSRDDPDFWAWLETRTNDRLLLGSWRDTAGIYLRATGRLEELRRYYEAAQGRWDERTRVNVAAELLYGYWAAELDEEASAFAQEIGLGPPVVWRAQMLRRFMERWQGGARGYAFECFAAYARRMPQDGMALNNMAWLVATARPDGLRHARREEWPAAAAAWAQQAIENGGRDIAAVWGTLAAARANAGDYASAQAAAERALALAAASGDEPMRGRLQAQLAEYQAGRPWRE